MPHSRPNSRNGFVQSARPSNQKQTHTHRPADAQNRSSTHISGHVARFCVASGAASIRGDFQGEIITLDSGGLNPDGLGRTVRENLLPVYTNHTCLATLIAEATQALKEQHSPPPALRLRWPAGAAHWKSRNN